MLLKSDTTADNNFNNYSLGLSVAKADAYIRAKVHRQVPRLPSPNAGSVS